MPERALTKADLQGQVAELEERIEGLEQELAAARAQGEERLDDLKRSAADFDNYRKRTARDQEALVARAAERLVRELIPVLDDLGRAAAQPPVREGGPGEGDRGNREVPPADSEALIEGVRLVHRSLEAALAREGLTEIETNGRFDPYVHEALLTQPSEAEEGSVLQVLQKGYRLGDRVIRPARVVVAGGTVEPAGQPAVEPPAEAEARGDGDGQ